MKKTILLLALLLPMALNAQQVLFEFEQVSNTDLKIVDESKVWTVCSPGDVQYKFEGDTVIKGFRYSKLNIDSGFSGICMREESRRVYLYCDPDNDYLYNRDTINIVLYDFNLQVGDTANMYYSLHNAYPRKEVVTYVDTTKINGVDRKKVCFLSGRWIEGIGSESKGILYPMALNYIDRQYLLKCVAQNEELIYGDCNVSCLQSIKGVLQIAISVVPTIVQAKFSIQAESTVPFQISVVDMQGRTQLQETVSAGEFVDCQCLPAGLYLVAVQTQKGEVVAVERIVKQ